MNIQTEKLELIEFLLKTENESLLKKVRAIFNSERKTKRISIEQYNKELVEAVDRINKGEFIRHEDVERESATW